MLVSWILMGKAVEVEFVHYPVYCSRVVNGVFDYVPFHFLAISI